MSQQVQSDLNGTGPPLASLETPELTQLLLAEIAALNNNL